MQRYFIYLAYNGSRYHGWQIQPNGISVQECLEKAVSLLLQDQTKVYGAGRTDAGVHARLMVAHIDTEAPLIDLHEFTDRLNKILPADISIFKTVSVKNEAHTRFDAISRTYKYYVIDQKDPFGNEYAWRLYGKLDLEKMNEAAALLPGFSDFTSFSKLHTDVKTNICRVTHAGWEKTGNQYVFTIQADRFLRNMVRAIVGTLVDVGRGKLSIDEFRKIIDSKNRCQAGTSAPAQGLFLVDIVYPEDLFT